MNDNLSNQELEAQLLASAKGQVIANDGSKLLIDRMHDLFDADDIVKVKNFTNHKVGWVYCDRRTTRIEQPNEFTRRVWQGEQKARVVDAGKSIIIPGWEAYVALNRFYQEWCNEEYPEMAGSYVLSASLQTEFLDKAYLGIQDINDLNSEPVVDVKKEVEDDLGLSDGKEAEKPSKSQKK